MIVFWSQIFLFTLILLGISAHLPPSENELLARYTTLSIVEQTPLPTRFSFFPLTFVTNLTALPFMFSSQLFRLPNILALAVFTITLSSFVTKPVAKNLIVFLVYTAPLLLHTALFDLNQTVGLIVVLILTKLHLQYPNQFKLLLIFSLLTPLFSSLNCLAVAGLTLWHRHHLKKMWVPIFSLSLLWLALFGLPQNNLLSRLSLSEQSFLVNQRVRLEFAINDHQETAPLPLKRLVYNKWYFSYLQLQKHLAGFFDFERWMFPGQMASTVANNLWSSKSLPWVSTWLFLIFLLALKSTSTSLVKLTLVFFISSLIFWLLFDHYPDSALLLTVPLVLVSAQHFAKPSRPSPPVLGCLLLILISTPALYYHLYFHQAWWRDNRPQVLHHLAKSTQNFDSVQITNAFGTTPIYIAHIYGLSASQLWSSIASQHFNHIKFGVSPDTVFKNSSVVIAFPGEVLGRRLANNFSTPTDLPSNTTLLWELPIKDSINYGNGDIVWALQKN